MEHVQKSKCCFDGKVYQRKYIVNWKQNIKAPSKNVFVFSTLFSRAIFRIRKILKGGYSINILQTKKKFFFELPPSGGRPQAV